MYKVKALCSLLGLAVTYASPLPDGPFSNTTAAAAFGNTTVAAGQPASRRIGGFILDDLDSCGSENAMHIENAVNNYGLLVGAAQGVTRDDPSFKSFFGTGWSGTENGPKFDLVAENIFKAGMIARPGFPPTARLTCNDVINHCRHLLGAYTLEMKDSDGVQTITFCPYNFDPVAGIAPLADRAKQTPQSHLNHLKSYEYVLLHELMHLDNVGYNTSFDIHKRMKPNHIWDVVHVFNKGKPPRIVYGTQNCFAYAQSKAPQLMTLVNADSYALFAASRYFSSIWSRTVAKRDDSGTDLGSASLDGSDPDAGPNEVVFDGDEILYDPDDACGDQAQPAAYDCASIQVPNDGNFPDLVQNCYTNGNHKWCDLYGNGNCQLTILYDVGSGAPPLNNSVISSVYNSTFVKPTDADCGPVALQQTVLSGCPTPGAGGALCPLPYTFLLKRLGVDPKFD